MKYDPDLDPDPAEWDAMNDGEKIVIISDYHKSNRIMLPNLMIHATLHAVVENQIAMGDTTEAKRTLDRLLAEGLDRHDAVHAIGSVLAGLMFNIVKHKKEADMEAYTRELRELSAQAWRQSGP